MSVELKERAEQNSPFARSLGIAFIDVTQERLLAQLTVRDDLCTLPAIAHGGVLMSFADTLGATATMLNLPDGAGTTTLESKTNFFAAAPVGSVIMGECTPLHRGRSTMVWQTRITNTEGRLLALVTQTQMVLQPRGG
jgi:uncharacterized protein (TIGR00369 family)